MISGSIADAMNPSFCFVAGTTVLTTLGKKAIEPVQFGDTIPCVDHITGEAAEKKVIFTTVNKVDKLIELDINGEIIQCTETHPFQVKGRGWVDAADLAPIVSLCLRLPRVCLWSEYVIKTPSEMRFGRRLYCSVCGGDCQAVSRSNDLLRAPVSANITVP